MRTFQKFNFSEKVELLLDVNDLPNRVVASQGIGDFSGDRLCRRIWGYAQNRHRHFAFPGKFFAGGFALVSRIIRHPGLSQNGGARTLETA